MPKTQSQSGMPAHIAGKRQYDLAWVQKHLDLCRISNLVSAHLHTLAQSELQRIVQTNGNPRCYSPIGIFKTYFVQLKLVESIETGPVSRMSVVCQTATEVEADEDSGDPRFGSNSITFDLETTTTVILTIKNGRIIDLIVEKVIV